jgi:hypothetical protein
MSPIWVLKVVGAIGQITHGLGHANSKSSDPLTSTITLTVEDTVDGAFSGFKTTILILANGVPSALTDPLHVELVFFQGVTEIKGTAISNSLQVLVSITVLLRYDSEVALNVVVALAEASYGAIKTNNLPE